MTQVPLPLEGSKTKVSYCERLAAYLKQRAGQWIDGDVLRDVGGKYAYRTRLSDLRKPPYSLVIENRQRKVGEYTVSEYRLVVAEKDVAA